MHKIRRYISTLFLVLFFWYLVPSLPGHATTNYTIIGKPLGLNYLMQNYVLSNGVPYFISPSNLLYMAEGSNDGYTIAVMAETLTPDSLPIYDDRFDYFFEYCTDPYCTNVVINSNYTNSGAINNFVLEGYSGTPGQYWYYITFNVPTTDFYIRSLYFNSQDGPEAFDGSYGFRLHSSKLAAFYRGTVDFNQSLYEPYQGSDDSSKPLISGYEGVYITNVDSPISIDTFKNQLRAVDDVDGDISNQITIEQDNYTANCHQLGLYDVIFRATDQAGNIATITVKFHVIDSSAPSFSGDSTVTSYTSDPLTIEEIQATIFSIDNYDGDLSSGIIVLDDDYTNFRYRIGTYPIVFQSSDSSGNTSTYSVNVVVVDDVKPIISGNAEYTKGTTVTLNKSQILSGLAAFDMTDGNLTSKIILVNDTYTGKTNQVGTYTLTYRVTDNSGNISDDFIVVIHVIDNIPPVFWVTAELINIDEFTTMNHEQIINLLILNGSLSEEEAELASFVADDYTGDESTIGVHEVKIEYHKQGKIQQLNLKMNVIAAEMDDIPDLIEYSFFDKIGILLSDACNTALTFFLWIWDYLLHPVLSIL